MTAFLGPSRRSFLLGTLRAGGALAGLGGLFRPAVADELRKAQKRAILVWMAGGPSQLETWDPKPGRWSAGPHDTIATAVPGLRFDEYMPRLARLADRMAVVRSVTSRSQEHDQATFAGLTGAARGRLPAPPLWLAACAHELAGDDAAWPALAALGPREGFAGDYAPPGGGFLGPGFDPVQCPGDGKPPDGFPASDADAETARRRDALRDRLSADFRYGHDPARADAHDAAYGLAGSLLARRGLFDLAREPARRADAYGHTRLGRDCLLACRLVERGVPFVLVTAPKLEWDLHREADTKQRQVTGRFDTAVGALVNDLVARGLWDHTLVALMGEFGRAPTVDGGRGGGRNHWSKCWSVSFGGAGVKPGVVGATDENGTDVQDRPVTVPDLLATFYAALGIDPRKEVDVDGRPTPLVERGAGKPIAEVL
jgi:hypothetical protein